MAERPEVTRRLALGRLIAGLILGAGILGALWVAGLHLFDGASRWLWARPAYQIGFAEIRLDPPPPAYIRGGAAALLSRVRTRSKRPETLSALGVDLEQLAADFKRETPWVREVGPISRGPLNRLAVKLAYREPLVDLRLSPAEIPPEGPPRPERDVILDRDRVVLPFDDIRFGAPDRPLLLDGTERPLILIRDVFPRGTTIESLAALTGRVLDPRGGGPDAVRFQEAMDLATFFQSREGKGVSADRAFRVIEMVADSQGWWLFLEQGAKLVTVRWPNIPPKEDFHAESGRRWAMLNTWIEADRGLADLQGGDFLVIETERVEVRRNDRSRNRP